MSVQEQVKWENECVERGTARYYQNQDRLRKQGQVEQVDSTSRLLRDRLEEISDKIKRIAVATAGRAGKYNKLLGHAAGPEEDFLKMAYIGARVVMTALINPKEATATKVCMDISTRLETDLKCRLFEEAYPAYYAVVARSLDEQNVVDYTHKHKVMMKKFNEFNIAWNPWGAVQKVQVGQKVLHCVLQVFEDVVFLEKRWSRGKSQYFLNTTVEFDEWSGEFERERGFLYPYLLPTKTPPASWESLSEGGFYTPRLRAAVPFIKIHRQAAKEWASENDPEQHRRAVSTMQRTPWRINQKVLEVQSHIYKNSLGAGMPSLDRVEPPKFPEHLAAIEKDNLTDSQKEEIRAWKEIAKRAYAKERERKGKVLAFMQSHKLAKELSTWEKFYFVYNCDFRGRIYCATSGLSPQGQDTAKGLLQFSTGVELGKTGIKWLAIHGANTFGVDKVSLAKRVAWIKQSEQIIAAVAANPISNRHLWGAADKPFQFLAFCFEWAACDYGRDGTAKSYIPVGMDGSCNGLQHYSAMLRDPVGAAATNLSDSDEPHDIYQEVADVVTRKLQDIDDPRAALWLKAGVTRKCAKRPVMTLPYGSTQSSARTYVHEYLIENWHLFDAGEEIQFELAQFLTPILWEAIGEVVIAARAAMTWLRENTNAEFMKWLSPVGFPVYQAYTKADLCEVTTQLNGGIRLALRDYEASNTPDNRTQKNGVAPNFIHSVDASHLVRTVNACDLQGYAMIHDDFGTHAAHGDRLYRAIRLTFKEMYADKDILTDWAEQVGANKETLPVPGEYDIRNILKSTYFFA